MKQQIWTIERKNCLDDIVAQVCHLWWVLLLCLGGSALVLAAVGVLTIIFDVPFAYFTRDPAAAVSGGTAPSYAGALSNLGVLVMAAAATVSLHAGWLLYHAKRARNQFWFIMSSGLFTTWLLLDDLYQIHEEVLPDHVGIPEEVVYALYVGLMTAYLLIFAGAILQTEYVLLLLALGFFALSIVSDFIPFEFAEHHLIEDGAKFVGMTLWCAYYLRLSWEMLQPMVKRSGIE